MQRLKVLQHCRQKGNRRTCSRRHRLRAAGGDGRVLPLLLLLLLLLLHPLAEQAV